MRRMHRIAKQDGFIIANVVQQVLVTLDKSRLLVSFARQRREFGPRPPRPPSRQCRKLGGFRTSTQFADASPWVADATSLRFHHPPPSAVNRAAVSLSLRACAWTSALREVW
jgi:hypothetical protein